jgi:transcriptional regulator with XRE-family HTH domain
MTDRALHNFAKNLRTLRRYHDETQIELAGILYISPSTLRAYESERQTPNLEVLVGIANHYNVSIDALIRDGNELPL